MLEILCAGNLAYFLSQGIDLQHALRKAMYASTMKIKVKSAQAGMPYKEDLEEFISSDRNKEFNYSKELNLALKMVKGAYDYVKANNKFQIYEKQDSTFVTDIDIMVEEFLTSEILKKFKKDNFLTEEKHPDGVLRERTWIIDPIDGTNHFIKNDGMWGIQLAFYDKGATQFSVIYLPKKEELYYAANGIGAFINNNKILNIEDVPAKSSVVEFAGSIMYLLDSKKIYFDKLLDKKKNKLKVLNIFHVNSSCISFTNLVSGKTNGLIISSKKLWDIMPGMFLCKEAGINSYLLDFNEDGLKLYTNSSELKELLLK